MTQPMLNTVYTQNELFEPSAYLNQSDPGFFSLLCRLADGTVRQSSWRLSELSRIIDLVEPQFDSWISQGSFDRPNRRAICLRSIGLLFSDLDIYNSPGLKGRPIDEVVSLLLSFCALEGLPPPSIVLFSGRGLQAKWLLDVPLLRASILRWNAVQKALCSVLDNFGADPKARDCSRVLRLERTVNTRTGEIVRVVHISGDPQNPVRYDFENLAQALLPRETPGQPTRERQNQCQREPLGQVQTLDWARLNDLRTLWALRGGCKEGFREVTLFWSMNFLVRACPVPMSQFWYEAQALASEIYPGSWYKESDLSTVYTKALSYRSGERVIFNGKAYPPLYTPRNDTLAEVFQITSDEERSLKTIISQREKDRRRAEKRWAEGSKPHTLSAERTRPWEALGMSRRTWYRKGCPQTPGTT